MREYNVLSLLIDLTNGITCRSVVDVHVCIGQRIQTYAQILLKGARLREYAWISSLLPVLV